SDSFLERSSKLSNARRYQQLRRSLDLFPEMTQHLPTTVREVVQLLDHDPPIGPLPFPLFVRPARHPMHELSRLHPLELGLALCRRRCTTAPNHVTVGVHRVLVACTFNHVLPATALRFPVHSSTPSTAHLTRLTTVSRMVAGPRDCPKETPSTDPLSTTSK